MTVSLLLRLTETGEHLKCHHLKPEQDLNRQDHHTAQKDCHHPNQCIPLSGVPSPLGQPYPMTAHHPRHQQHRNRAEGLTVLSDHRSCCLVDAELLPDVGAGHFLALFLLWFGIGNIFRPLHGWVFSESSVGFKGKLLQTVAGVYGSLLDNLQTPAADHSPTGNHTGVTSSFP